METRGSWDGLIPDVGLKFADVVDQGLELYTPGIFRVLTQTTGSGAQRNYTGKTPLGRLHLTAEGDAYNIERRYKTYDTQVPYFLYSNGIQVTRLQIEDRDFDAELDEMKDLARSANYSQDEAGMQLFNGGFSTSTSVNGYTVTLYADGVATYSTLHPSKVPGASTQSNASSTGIVFSHDNLEVPMVALVEQQTDNGLAMSMGGKPMVILPPALQREGREITESTLESETGNNAINVYRGTVDMATSTFLSSVNGGSNTAWFVVVPGMDKQFHEVRQAPRLEMGQDINTKSLTFTVDARWADYVLDWRRKWGSKGDLAAYSS